MKRGTLLLGQSQGFVIFKGAKNPALAKLLAQYLITAPALLAAALTPVLLADALSARRDGGDGRPGT